MGCKVSIGMLQSHSSWGVEMRLSGIRAGVLMSFCMTVQNSGGLMWAMHRTQLWTCAFPKLGLTYGCCELVSSMDQQASSPMLGCRPGVR